jgi:hypothetical protein
MRGQCAEAGGYDLHQISQRWRGDYGMGRHTQGIACSRVKHPHGQEAAKAVADLNDEPGLATAPAA